jgi:hypothetical protein
VGKDQVRVAKCSEHVNETGEILTSRVAVSSSVIHFSTF